MISFLVAALIAASTILIMVAVSAHRDARRLRVTTLRLLIPGLPEALCGRRVVFLCDLHVDRLYVPVEHLLASVEEAQPTLLLLGGDLAYMRVDHQATLVLIEKLSAICPTFAVRGNTDVRQYLDSEALRGILSSGSGDLLVNQAAKVSVDGATLEVLGVDDPLEGDSDPARTLSQADPEADLRIGLGHSPAQWQELAAFNAHICIFGHTHGGQIRVPGLEAPVTHSSYSRRLAAGLFRYTDASEPGYERVVDHWRLLAQAGGTVEVSAGDRNLFFVSRGVGVSWLPLRLFCPPEMVVIEFATDNAEGA